MEEEIQTNEGESLEPDAGLEQDAKELQAAAKADLGEKDTDEEAPKGSRLDKRLKKQFEKVKQLEASLQAKDAQLSQLKEAENLVAVLKSNPKAALVLMDYLEGKEEKVKEAKEELQDDYDSVFDPLAAKKFKQLDEALQLIQHLKSKLDEQSQTEEQTIQKALEENEASLEEHWISLLKSDGLLGKDGALDPDLDQDLQLGVLLELSRKHGDDFKWATPEELTAAYEKVKNARIKTNKIMRNKKTTPVVPLTNSNGGTTSVPSGNKEYSLEEQVRLFTGG